MGDRNLSLAVIFSPRTKVAFKQRKSNQGDGEEDVDERKLNFSSGVAFIWPKKVLNFLDSDGKMKI